MGRLAEIIKAQRYDDSNYDKEYAAKLDKVKPIESRFDPRGNAATDALSRFGVAVGNTTGGFISGAGGYLPGAVGDAAHDFGRWLEDTSQNWERENLVPMQQPETYNPLEVSWTKPGGGWAQVGNLLGSQLPMAAATYAAALSLPYLLPAGAAAAITGAGAAAKGAGVFSRLISPLAGAARGALASLGGTGVEALVEGGAAYNDAKREGFTDEQAQKMANSVSLNNLGGLTATNMLEGALAGKLFSRLANGAAGRLTKKQAAKEFAKSLGAIAANHAINTYEEGMQEGFQRVAKDMGAGFKGKPTEGADLSHAYLPWKWNKEQEQEAKAANIGLILNDLLGLGGSSYRAYKDVRGEKIENPADSQPQDETQGDTAAPNEASDTSANRAQEQTADADSADTAIKVGQNIVEDKRNLDSTIRAEDFPPLAPEIAGYEEIFDRWGEGEEPTAADYLEEISHTDFNSTEDELNRGTLAQQALLNGDENYIQQAADSLGYSAIKNARAIPVKIDKAARDFGEVTFADKETADRFGARHPEWQRKNDTQFEAPPDYRQAREAQEAQQPPTAPTAEQQGQAAQPKAQHTAEEQQKAIDEYYKDHRLFNHSEADIKEQVEMITRIGNGDFIEGYKAYVAELQRKEREKNAKVRQEAQETAGQEQPAPALFDADAASDNVIQYGNALKEQAAQEHPAPAQTKSEIKPYSIELDADGKSGRVILKQSAISASASNKLDNWVDRETGDNIDFGGISIASDGSVRKSYSFADAGGRDAITRKIGELTGEKADTQEESDKAENFKKDDKVEKRDAEYDDRVEGESEQPIGFDGAPEDGQAAPATEKKGETKKAAKSGADRQSDAVIEAANKKAEETAKDLSQHVTTPAALGKRVEYISKQHSSEMVREAAEANGAIFASMTRQAVKAADEAGESKASIANFVKRVGISCQNALNKLFLLDGTDIDITHEDGAAHYLRGTAEIVQKLRQFAGIKAETADIAKLDLAKWMEKNGKSDKEILKKTGWLKGDDGFWRFYIPDNLSGIDVGWFRAGSSSLLNKAYKNPKLYSAYPELKHVLVIFVHKPKANYGGYSDTGKNLIVLNLPKFPEDMDLKKALVHEVQHFIQDIEGFAEGTSPEYFEKRGDDEATAKKKYLNAAGEIEARQTEWIAELEQESKDKPAQRRYNKDVIRHRLLDKHPDAIIIFGGKEVAKLAMFRSKASSLAEFYESVNPNKKDTSKNQGKNFYRITTNKDNIIDVPSDTVLQHIGKHDFTAEQLDAIEKSLENIVGYQIDDNGRGDYNGAVVRTQIHTPAGKAGVCLEFTTNRRIFLKTVFFDGEANIENWVNKKKVVPNALETDKSETAVFVGQPSIDSIRRELAKVKPFGLDFSNAKQYNQMMNSEAKGATTIYGGGDYRSYLIELMNKADYSTLPHESAHLFRDHLRALAQKFPHSQAARDNAKLEEWETWREGQAAEYKGTATEEEFAAREKAILKAIADGNKAEEARLKDEWANERFARGFEEYLRQGKAPNSALKRVFEQFKKWLTILYNKAVGARAPLSVEEVMARMVGEIEAREQAEQKEDIADDDLKYIDWAFNQGGVINEAAVDELVEDAQSGDKEAQDLLDELFSLPMAKDLPKKESKMQKPKNKTKTENGDATNKAAIDRQTTQDALNGDTAAKAILDAKDKAGKASSAEDEMEVTFSRGDIVGLDYNEHRYKIVGFTDKRVHLQTLIDGTNKPVDKKQPFDLDMSIEDFEKYVIPIKTKLKPKEAGKAANTGENNNNTNNNQPVKEDDGNEPNISGGEGGRTAGRPEVLEPEDAQGVRPDEEGADEKSDGSGRGDLRGAGEERGGADSEAAQEPDGRTAEAEGMADLDAVPRDGERGNQQASADGQRAGRGGDRGNRADGRDGGERGRVKGNNFHITDEAAIGEGGEKTKFKNNVAAIELLHKLEAEGRMATPSEQAILAKFNGWGSVASAFSNDPKWQKEKAILKELLTPEEYEAAEGATRNAHYTSPTVVKAMWKFLQHIGFNGGRILEPSMGVGNFFGLMPQEIMDKSELHGVELDPLTGRLAKQLYQQADIRITGFEKAPYPDGYFDLAISNVPFGSVLPVDSRYDKYGYKIHNYFFAKALDKVRPGGLIAFITSTGTMQSGSSSAKLREMLANKANLLCMIKLPNTAFKANAGTEVTTDIIFFQKVGDTVGLDIGNAYFTKIEKLTVQGQQVPINKYFTLHPDHMLGTPVIDKLHQGRMGLDGKGVNIEERLDMIIDLFADDIYTPAKRRGAKDAASDTAKRLAPVEARNHSYYIGADGKAYQNVDGEAKLLPAAQQPIAQSYINVRNSLKTLLKMEISPEFSEKEVEKARATLNKAYDNFRKTSKGFIGDYDNILNGDPEFGSVAALEPDYKREKGAKKGKATKKAAIFDKRAIEPIKPLDKADNASDALTLCLANRGAVDIDFMAQMSGLSEKQLLADLKGQIFLNPASGNYETRDEYLSGKTRRKLREAEEAAKSDPRYEENVAALKKAQPPRLGPGDVSLPIGSRLIPAADYEDFAASLVGKGKAAIEYIPALNAWRVNAKAASSKWTAGGVAFSDLLEAALNNKTIHKQTKSDDAALQELVRQEEAAANGMVEKIKEEFGNWLWQDKARTKRLLDDYNENMNDTVLRKYDGSHLTFPGMSKGITLRRHQRDAVWRIMQRQNTLLAHCVGAGKTFTMQAAAMEMRRLGICRKPMFVLPNNVIKQFEKEFYELYPSAKILVVSAEQLPAVYKEKADGKETAADRQKRDANAAKRRAFLARIQMEDWDGILITDTMFSRLPISPEYQARHIEREKFVVEQAVKAQKGNADTGLSKRDLKNLKNKLDNLNNRLEKALGANKDDIAIPFDELGIDQLFVDEADRFKNLFTPSGIGTISGVNTSTDSMRASDMYMKTQYLTAANNGRGVVFATGTPVANSLTEMFTMERYLAGDMLKEYGLDYFDNWLANFTQTAQVVERSPSGDGLRTTTGIAKFVNAPEMVKLFRSVADVVRPDALARSLAESADGGKIPKLKGGKRTTVTLKRSSLLETFIHETIAKRYKAIRDGQVEPTEDNMLSLTSDLRKASLDMRLVSPEAREEIRGQETEKIAAVADNVARIFKESEKVKGAQLIFCDMGTPKTAVTVKENEDTDADADSEANEAEDDSNIVIYAELKKAILNRGIPAKQVAFVHDAKNKEQQKALFEKVRRGEVRVLIGSTEKMGAGTNCQDHLVALHHVDCPWRPRDIEQREGRILRQGNQNAEVEILSYVVQDSYDANMWEKVKNKSRIIEQVMSDDVSSREIEDVGVATASFAEIEALSTGDPRMKEKVLLDVEQKKLAREKVSYERDAEAREARRQDLPKLIKDQQDYIDKLNADKKRAVRVERGKDFAITIGGGKYTSWIEAEKALREAVEKAKESQADAKLGEVGGFPFRYRASDNKVVIAGELSYTSSRTIEGLVNTVNQAILGNHKYEQDKLDALKNELRELKAYKEEPFPKAKRLKEITARLKELNEALGNNEEQPEIDETPKERNFSNSAANFTIMPDGVTMRVMMADKKDKRAASSVAKLRQKYRAEYMGRAGYYKFPTTYEANLFQEEVSRQPVYMTEADFASMAKENPRNAEYIRRERENLEMFYRMGGEVETDAGGRYRPPRSVETEVSLKKKSPLAPFVGKNGLTAKISSGGEVNIYGFDADKASKTIPGGWVSRTVLSDKLAAALKVSNSESTYGADTGKGRVSIARNYEKDTYNNPVYDGLSLESYSHPIAEYLKDLGITLAKKDGAETTRWSADADAEADARAALGITDEQLIPKAKHTFMQKILAKFGEALGAPIKFFNDPSRRGVRGAYDSTTNTMYINAAGNISSRYVFFHELTHWLRSNHPSIYNSILARWEARGAERMLSKEKIDAYRKNILNGDELTAEQVLEEMVADAMMQPATRKQLFEALAHGNLPWYKRFAAQCVYWFDEHFAKPLKNAPKNGLDAKDIDDLAIALRKTLDQVKDYDGKRIFVYDKGKLYDRETRQQIGTEDMEWDAEEAEAAPYFETEEAKREIAALRGEYWGGDENAAADAPSVAENIARGKEAVSQVLKTRQDVNAAMYRPEVGDIDFVYGEVGNPAKDYKGGFGIAHILAKHGQEAIDKIPDVIANGQAYQKYKDRVYFLHNNYIASVRLDFDGKRKTWLVTNFENKKETAFADVFVPSANTAAMQESDGGEVSLGNNITLNGNNVKYSASPSQDVKQIHEWSLNRLMEKIGLGDWWKRQGMEAESNVTINEKPKDPNIIPAWKQVLYSPTRLAKDFPKLAFLVNLGHHATEVQEHLRNFFTDEMNKVEKLLGYNSGIFKRNDPNYEQNREDWCKILWAGDVQQKEFTADDLRKDGHNEKVIEAYKLTRAALKKARDIANEARQRIESHSKNMTAAELAELEAWAVNNSSIKILKKTKRNDGKILVEYRAPRFFERQDIMSEEKLTALKADKQNNQILEAEKIAGDDTARNMGLEGDIFYNVRYRSQTPPIGEINGYIPHLFHDWFVIAKVKTTADGEERTVFQMLKSADTLRLATMRANEYAAQNPNVEIIIAPKMMEFPNAASQATVMGDRDYFKTIKKFSEGMTMTPQQAKQVLEEKAGIARRNRRRFLGAAQHRTRILDEEGNVSWVQGYEENVVHALRHHFNQVARYVALDEFKSKAISYYERMFGDFDKDAPSPLAQYAKNYIHDMNGDPTNVEKWLNNVIETTPLLNKIASTRVNGRPALWAAGGITRINGIAKLGFLNFASAMMNYTQLLNLAGALDADWKGYGYIGDGIKMFYAATRMDAHDKPINPNLHNLLYEKLRFKDMLGADVAGGYSKAEVADRFFNNAMIGFRTADVQCRGVALLGAYQHYKEKGFNESQAIAKAKDVNRMVNFDYATSDAPEMFRRLGPLASVLFQFQKFPVKQIELFHDIYKRGKAKDGYTGAAKDLIKYTAPYMLLSGVMGIPFISVMGGALNLLMAHGDDRDWDWMERLKQYIFEHFGNNPLTRAALYGALAAPADYGIDIGARIGIGDFNPADVLSAKSKREVVGKLLGPTGSSIESVITQWFNNGNFAEGVKAFSPGLGNLWIAANGEVRTTRGRVRYKYDGLYERALRAIGVTPINERTATDENRVRYNQRSQMAIEKKNAIDDFLDEPTDRNLQRVKELGISPKTVQSERMRRKLTPAEIARQEAEEQAKRRAGRAKTYRDGEYYK